MPGFVIGSPLAFVGESWVGASDAAGGGVQPPLFAGGNVFHGPRIILAVKPAALANAPAFHAARIRLAIQPPAFDNTPGFFAAAIWRAIDASAFSNAPTFFGPRLILRLSPATYANFAVVYAPGVAPTGTKSAPHLASGAQIFSPSLVQSSVSEVIGTLNVAGWTPRAPARRRQVATWPNLPKVEAPPWRLMVVTPEVARERARAQIAWRKRAREQKRKRDVDRRVEAIFNQIVDDEVVRTVVRLVGEDA